MNELDKLRNKIDIVDKKIIELFEERMNLVLKVAEYKKQNNIPILNENREEEVIKKNIKYLKDKSLKLYLEEFLKDMMSVSKKFQHDKINK